MKNTFNSLCISLPEDIKKAKYHGDFKRAIRLIDMHLQSDKTASCMKERLAFEKLVLKELPREYPYSVSEALEIIQKEIKDFTEEELNEWIDTEKVDWIYVDGEIHLFNRFFSTMKKVYPDIAKRCGIAKTDENFKLLEENMSVMKQKGYNSYHFHVKSSIQIHDDAFVPNKKVHVHLPIPSNCINIENIKILDYTNSPVTFISDANSRTIYFEEIMEENHPFFVEYEYDSTSKYNHLTCGKESSNFKEYTYEKNPAIVFTPLIKALAKELKGDETDPLKIARNFYDYCTTKVTYSFMRKYVALPYIPDYVGASLKGDCGVQALLFITLCRATGIPAHFQSGLYTTPYDIGCHDWAMFYVEPYGWLFADPSFGGSAFRANRKELHDFYFGNLDPFRMVANNDVCNEFEPAKKYLRSDPYDNQIGEIEYDDYGLTEKDFSYKQVILENHQNN